MLGDWRVADPLLDGRVNVDVSIALRGRVNVAVSILFGGLVNVLVSIGDLAVGTGEPEETITIEITAVHSSIYSLLKLMH